MSSDGESPTRADRAAIAYRLAKLDEPTLRRDDVSKMTGVDSEQSLRWWRALGFAEVADDEVAFREADVAVVQRLKVLVDSGVVDDADIARLARLMSTAYSRLVDAQLDVLDLALDSVGASTDRSGRLSELADAEIDVFDFIESTMTYVWRRHLLAAIGHRLSVDRDEHGRAVAFADLAGFSRVTKEASPEELTRLIDSFEATAFDVVSGHGGRVVKLIGDEVMYVSDTLADALDTALELIARLAAVDGMPPVHCGAAFGPTVTVGGDVFGPTVNLASRLTSVARGGSVVVPRADSEHLLDRDDLDVRRVRRHYDLKGIGRTAVLVVRPLETSGSGIDGPNEP